MFRLTAVALLAILLGSVPVEAAISADGLRVVKEVNAALDGVPKNTAYAAGDFGGNEAAVRAHLASAASVAKDCNRELRFLIRDSGEPEVRAAQARVSDLMQYVKTVNDALSGSGQNPQQLRAMVFDFVEEYLSKGLVSRGGPLTALQRDPKADVSIGGDTAEMQAVIKELEAVDAGCKGKYRAVVNEKHPANPALDPALWCATAANRQTLLRKSTESMMASGFDVAIGQFTQLKKDLESREGFLATNEDVLKVVMVDRETLRNELRKRYQPQMDQAGITSVDDLLARFDPAIGGLRTEIERLAPRWQFPAAGPHDPAPEALARAQVPRAHPGGAVRATVMSHATFKIHKNALGIPLYRYKDGFVLYKLPAESLCRQHGFTYTETFDGRGYQKPSGVRLNYTRFQRCQ